MLKADPLPLNALRAFEVAARTGSFVAAGAELGVSAAAISQQVRALETRLDKQLFLRQGNRITLTDAGRTLYPSVDMAFGELLGATRLLRAAPRRERLVVSVLPSLADLWLLPGLRGFDGRARLDLRVEDDPVDMAREGIDLRLTYGAQYYPDHLVEVLFADRLIAVAAPDFAADDPANVPDADLIHTDWGRAYGVQPEWARHFDGLGLRRVPDRGQGLRVNSTALAAAAARTGLGVALLPERLAAEDVAAGRLRILGASVGGLLRDYVMVSPHARGRHRGLLALRRHLSGLAQGGVVTIV